jgi:hypothetical protein
MNAKDFELLEETIDGWTRGRQEGKEAWAKIKQSVLDHVLEQAPRRRRSIHDARVASAEKKALCEFMQDVFVASFSLVEERAQADVWIKAMTGLDVDEPNPSMQTIETSFKARILEAMTNTLKRDGRIKFVKACICMEIVRAVEASVGGFAMAEVLPEKSSVGTLLSVHSSPRNRDLQKRFFILKNRDLEKSRP